MPGWPALLTPEQARAYLALPESTFVELRRLPWFPRAIQINPKVVRFSRQELDLAISAMPRQALPTEPTQLLRARINRAKATGVLS